ncbi:TPA: hypothetical protein DCW54_01515 [Candidatus Dependentiae bacterium]|nr:hypothetical protein [Candidatus Dependentiae bacterium]
MNLNTRFWLGSMVILSLCTPSLQAKKRKKRKPRETIEYVQKEKKHTPTAEELINELLRPISFTQEGLKRFIQQYNTSFYVERFLPACFIHLIDFLEFGQQQEKTAQFFLSVLALFTQRLQACEWVNPYALLALMERMEEVLKTQCMRVEDQDTFTQVQTELKRALLENFDLLKEQPEEFLQKTATQISQTVQFSNAQYVIRELQAAVTQFLLTATNKLIWHPREKGDSWRMMVAIANLLQGFFESHLIATYEDLNLLIWSLVYRFGYFIECAGSQLTPDVYKIMQNELQEKKHAWLFLREQEAEMTSKEGYLISALMRGITKAEAYTSGLSVDRFI